MSSLSSHLIQRCRQCTAELASDALVCPRCDALVHSEELDRLAAEAKQMEENKQWRAAREKWLAMLPLLPKTAEQGSWIRKHAQELLNAAVAQEAPAQKNEWAKRLGPLAPIAALLAKSKGVVLALFKMKFLLSLAAFVGVYWALYGARFGIGFAALILIHEMGHFTEVKRRGLPAEMPVFLPGIGAYVKWQALGVSLETRAAVSLAGPLAGWLSSVACVFVWWTTRDPLWAALAHAGAWLNIFNLIPVWILDGGQAALALGKTDRFWLLAAAVALWALLGEGMFFLVAAGATWRLFTKDQPEKPSRMILAYYLAVLVFLGLVLRVVPTAGR